MSWLMYTIVFTRNFDAMRSFYRERVGLSVRHEEPQWVEFDTGGAVLALHDMPDERKQGIDLRFESRSLEADVEALGSRGVKFDGQVIEFSKGRLVNIWDPEGNLLSVFEPRVPAFSGTGPQLEGVILNARDFDRMVMFYRGRMGFAVATEGPRWVEFDTGDTKLAVHERPAGGGHPRHAEQPIALVFAAPDLDGWCGAMRARGLELITEPVEREFGLYAEAMDPDGRIVVFRESAPAESTVEALAEAYDDAPRRAAIRKPVKKGSAALSALSVKPAYKSKRSGARKRPSATTMSVASVRGAGAEGARLKPKRTGDEKKAKVKPATLRMQKAKRRVLKSQKRAAATAGKRRPVKQAARKVAGRRGR